MVKEVSGRTTKLGALLSVIAVVIIGVSLINTQFQIPKMASAKSIIYDKSIEEVIGEISKSVPQNETLVVSDYPTHFKYFSHHTIKVPWGITSEDILANNMVQNNRKYLVVVENSSAEPGLRTLFSSAGLPLLDQDFDKVMSYKSDFYLIHLYKIKES